MSDDPIEGMALELCRAEVDGFDAQARAAWAYALTRLSEPSEAMLDCGTVTEATAGPVGPRAVDEVETRRRATEGSSRTAFRAVFRRAIDVFAREHGLRVPRAAPPGAGEGASAPRQDATGHPRWHHPRNRLKTPLASISRLPTASPKGPR